MKERNKKIWLCLDRRKEITSQRKENERRTDRK